MSASPRQTVVVVGNGMMSFRLCQRLVECGAVPGPLRVVVFGEEPRPAYDRVRLSEMLGGAGADDLCLAPADWYHEHGIELHVGDPVVDIDREACAVTSAAGVTLPYDRLVLATGSRALVPEVPGAALPGVFTYRTVDDLRAILEHARGRARAAVIGGGLLGLEAAWGLATMGLEVHVVEASRGLLARQLDAAGATLLREKVETLGLHVHCGARTQHIDEAGGGLSVGVADGFGIEVDLVVLSAGIRPRGELAREAGLLLAASGGVIVDDHLASSDPRIFAVGECATHRGVTYGLAAPGYRMIDVLVDNLVGGDAVFQGAFRSARLELPGVSVAAVGRYEETAETQAHAYLAGGVYRKLVLLDGRIVGALAIGEWSDLERVRAALDEPRSFSFWDLRRFRSTGSLWLRSESPPIHEWPADALVCGCVGVRRGALTEAEMTGCATVAELSSRTGAGTLCGACRPLLEDLVRRARADSLPPSQLEREPDSPPPTLRCSGAPDSPAAVTLPRPARSPVFIPRSEAATLLAAPAAPMSGRALTLVSGTAAPASAEAPIRLPTLPPPSSRSPVSSRRSDTLVSSSRELLAPLRPISVPPSRVSGLLSGRLPPSLAPPPPRSTTGLQVTAVGALAGSVLLAVAPAATPARSFRGLHAEALWTRRSYAEASGYAIVALGVLGLVLSLRKRWKRFTFGDVASLRVLHGALGVAALGCLLCHTGLHAGERLNRLLTVDFLAASALGGLASGTHALGDPGAAPQRRLLVSRAHLLVLIPLPVLLALHILGAYYF